MQKRIWLANLVLAASMVGLGWKLVSDWKRYAREHDPQALPVRALALPAEAAPLVPPQYSAIAERNPFHQDRNDLVASNTQEQPAGPPPLVYGSVIVGGKRFALLAAEGDPKPQKVAEGEMFGGHKLVRVSPKSVVFGRAGTETEVMFYNTMERLRRAHEKTSLLSAPSAAPAVVSTGGTVAPGSGGMAAPAIGAGGSAPGPVQPSSPATQPGVRKRLMQTPFGPIWVEDRSGSKPQ